MFPKYNNAKIICKHLLLLNPKSLFFNFYTDCRCLVRSYLTMAEESDEKCQSSKKSSDKSPKQQLLCKAVEGLRDAFHVCLISVIGKMLIEIYK